MPPPTPIAEIADGTRTTVFEINTKPESTGDSKTDAGLITLMAKRQYSQCAANE